MKTSPVSSIPKPTFCSLFADLHDVTTEYYIKSACIMFATNNFAGASAFCASKSLSIFNVDSTATQIALENYLTNCNIFNIHVLT